MTELAERRQRIAIARDEFLNSGRSRTEVVPDVVAASWERSISAGVDAATSQAICYRDLDLHCSQPRDLIVKALRDEEGNRVRAAEVLGIARSSLYRKLKSYGITAV